MSELVLQEPTFALSSTDAIDLLLAEREQAVDSINAVAGVMADARASAVLGYFVEAEQKNVPTDEERLKHGGALKPLSICFDVHTSILAKHVKENLPFLAKYALISA